MSRDKAIGIGILVLSVVVPLLIIYLLFFSPYDVQIMTLKMIVTLAIVALCGVVGWIGYTLATTPPPKPIEEIEKEIEEELKKLEQETKKD